MSGPDAAYYSIMLLQIHVFEWDERVHLNHSRPLRPVPCHVREHVLVGGFARRCHAHVGWHARDGEELDQCLVLARYHIVVPLNHASWGQDQLRDCMEEPPMHPRAPRARWGTPRNPNSGHRDKSLCSGKASPRQGKLPPPDWLTSGRPSALPLVNHWSRAENPLKKVAGPSPTAG